MRDIYRKLLLEYEKNLKVRDYKSQKTYCSTVKDFLLFHQKRAKKGIKFNQADMIAYYEHLTTRNNKRRSGTLSQSTINHHLFAVSLLFDYMLTSNKVDALPVVSKFRINKEIDMEILSVEEIKELYKSCKNQLETAVLSTAYGAGLRRAEIHDLNITDVKLRDSTLIVQRGKNSKRREVPLSDRVVEDLKDYLHNYRTLKSIDRKAFFVNKRGTRMSGNTLNQIVKRIAERTGLQTTISLHTFRRSIATHLAENGAGIYFIQEFLGHSLIDTSHLYAIKRKRNTKL
ncbi:MAG: site-specific integrase [Flavobacteriales bacterium]|nr:site-specific integrase [Flavobacteriales bacterium]